MSGNPFRRTRSSSLPSYTTQDPRHPQIQKHQQDQANGHRRSHSHRHRRHRCTNRVKPDTIDKLDNLYGGPYHHEGPFDAACRERNKSLKYSPIDALKYSNEETLKATPREKIVDSLTKHKPLDGVAYYPPGTVDWTGHKYDYEEGNNMMTEDRGNFRRWPGEKFRDEDFKNDPYYQRLQADLDAQAKSFKRRSWGLRRRKNSQ